jgi:hypothetical protein|tara:strand:+ start:473 stop:835 length:363 start_codon:yes stop_codon:yes gene_type:complete
MPAKKIRSRKKSIKDISQTHAKEEFQPTTLDQIWGDTGSSTYGTMDEKVYVDKLDNMNLSDLQAHASTVGIIPIDNRSMLRERLLREFRKHVSSYRKPTQDVGGSKMLDDQAMKILSEGR